MTNSQPSLQPKRHHKKLNVRFLRGLLLVAAIIVCCETLAQFIAPPQPTVIVPYRGVTLKLPVIEDTSTGLLALPDWLLVSPKTGSLQDQKNITGSAPPTKAKTYQTPQRIVICGGSGIQSTICSPFQSFPGRLQHLLQAQGYDTLVLNAGIQGGDASEEYLYIKNILETVHPDIVLMYVGSNEYLRLRAWKDKYPEWTAESEMRYSYLERSAIFRFLANVFKENSRPPIETFDMANLKDNLTNSDHVLVNNLYYNKLLQIGEVCRQHSAKLIFCPAVYNEAQETFLPRQRFGWTTVQAADQAGALFFDIKEYLKKNMKLHLDGSVFIDFTHFSPYGNECVARAIFHFLQANHLLPPTKKSAICLPPRPQDIQELDYVRGRPLHMISAYFIEDYRLQMAPINTLPGTIQRGHLCFTRQRYAQASSFYLDACSQMPQDPINWRNLAHALCLSRHYREALQSYSHAWELGKAAQDPDILQDAYLKDIIQYSQMRGLISSETPLDTLSRIQRISLDSTLNVINDEPE